MPTILGRCPPHHPYAARAPFISNSSIDFEIVRLKSIITGSL
jgi:hypothetical protein